MLRYPLYWLLRAFARAAAWIYFGRVLVRGRANVPASGPVILAANHPQSILDAIVISVSSRRTVHYLAHAGLFRNRFQRWILRASGVIPIFRREDRSEANESNEDAFVACREILERGGCIGIFPEGTSLEERRVQPLKTGTARIALDAEMANQFELGVAIVPLGLNFESRQRFRSSVLASLGEPIRAADYAERYAQHSAGAVEELTSELHERISRLVIDVDHSELEEFVAEVERIYKDELLRSVLKNFESRDPFDREHFASQEIAKATQFFYEHDRERLSRVRASMESYARKLARLRLEDEVVRDADQGYRDRASRLVAVVALAAPVALFGFLWNVVPYQLTRLFVRRLSPDGTKTHFHQLTQGAWIFVLCYVAYWFWLNSMFGVWRTLLLLTSFALSGFFSLRFIEALRKGRKLLRFALLRATHRVMIQRLVALRRSILREMEEGRRIYLRNTEITE